MLVSIDVSIQSQSLLISFAVIIPNAYYLRFNSNQRILFFFFFWERILFLFFILFLLPLFHSDFNCLELLSGLFLLFRYPSITGLFLLLLFNMNSLKNGFGILFYHVWVVYFESERCGPSHQWCSNKFCFFKLKVYYKCRNTVIPLLHRKREKGNWL